MHMEFIIKDSSVKDAPRTMFSTVRATLRVVTVVCGDHTFGFSRWEDEDVWYADSLILPNGAPMFVHGEGTRECAKSPASPTLQDGLNEHFGL